MELLKQTTFLYLQTDCKKKADNNFIYNYNFHFIFFFFLSLNFII